MRIHFSSVPSNLGEVLYTLVIYLWLLADVTSYRNRSFIHTHDY